ncbi:MAG: TRAP transporter small permease [Mesorhizobium sp.]|nr:TRAP transporter small permease [Mesorhizobium sp.]MCO5161808.1 TRAP transporter small permease [Mesorhizobium sp.]
MDMQPHSPADEPGAILSGPLRRVADVMGALGAVLVLALALLINTDVVSRFVLNHPMKGVAELVELSIVIIVFVQLPTAIATGGLIRSSELHNSLNARHPAAGKAFAIVFELVGVLIFALFAWGVWPRFIEAWNDGLYKGQPGVFTAPTWPAELAIVVGATVASLCFAASCIARVRRA